jgi:hypothetical protein
MFTLARAYEKSKEFPKVIPLLREVLEKRISRLGRGHRDTLKVMSYLASAYVDNGQSDALPLFTEVYERRKTMLGSENQDTLKSMYDLALAYRFMNDLDASLDRFQKLLALTEKGKPLPKGYPQVSDTKNRIAEILPLVNPKQQ